MVDSCSEEAEAGFMEPITAPREVLTQPTAAGPVPARPEPSGAAAVASSQRSKIREDKIVARLTAGDDDGVRATCDEAGDDDREAATSGGDAGDDGGGDGDGDGGGGETRGGDGGGDGGEASGGSVATTGEGEASGGGSGAATGDGSEGGPAKRQRGERGRRKTGDQRKATRRASASRGPV